MLDLPDNYDLIPPYRIVIIEQVYKNGGNYKQALDSLVKPGTKSAIRNYFNWLRANDIIADRNNGMSVKELQEKYNLCLATISKISATATKTDISARSSSRKSEIIKLYDAGMSRIDLADKFNCSKSLIYRILSNRKSPNSICRRVNILKRDLTELEINICQAYHMGYGVKYISWKYNIPYSTVRYKCGPRNLDECRKHIESLQKQGMSIANIAVTLYRLEWQIKDLMRYKNEQEK